MTAPVAKIVLRDRRFRWRSPIGFNDPFDVTQELRRNFTNDELVRRVGIELARLIEEGASPERVRPPGIRLLLAISQRLDADKRREIAEEIRANPLDSTAAQQAGMAALDDVWAREVRKARVFCVSEANDITPMWLHYADNYRGVVLQLRPVDEIDSVLLIARPVIYQDAPPRISTLESWVACMFGLDGLDYMTLFAECQYVKTLAWAYEREWRVVGGARPGDPELHSDFGFGAQELEAVFFGSECTQEDREEILAIIREPQYAHAHAFQAVRDVHAGRFRFNAI